MLLELENGRNTEENLSHIKNRRFAEEPEFSYDQLRSFYTDRVIHIEGVIDSHFDDLYGADDLSAVKKLTYKQKLQYLIR